VAWVEGGAPEGDPAYLPHKIPTAAPEQAAPPHYGKSLNVARSMTLDKSATLVAIRPDGASEAWAMLPDGTVKRLIWLHDYQKAWARTYQLREPEGLPAGTQLRVEGATASFLLR
jgi:hypothetical protein